MNKQIYIYLVQINELARKKKHDELQKFNIYKILRYQCAIEDRFEHYNNINNNITRHAYRCIRTHRQTYI